MNVRYIEMVLTVGRGDKDMVKIVRSASFNRAGRERGAGTL